MRFWSRILAFVAALTLISCSGSTPPSSPIQTFQTYTKAIKQKDTTTMKLLLSDATIKMHQQEAKARGVTVDDIVKQETLFSADQRSVEYRNEKIDGDKATLEVKDPSGTWVTVPFVREEGVWKIDEVSQADQMERDIDEQMRQFDDNINSSHPQF